MAVPISNEEITSYDRNHYPLRGFDWSATNDIGARTWMRLRVKSERFTTAVKDQSRPIVDDLKPLEGVN